MDNKFMEEMWTEYKDLLRDKAFPFEISQSVIAKRRKDIAKKLTEICIKNNLTIKESIILLLDLINGLRSNHTKFNDLFDSLYPVSISKEPQL